MQNQENCDRRLAGNNQYKQLKSPNHQELLDNEALYRTLLKYLPSHKVMVFDSNLRCLLAEGKEVLAVVGNKRRIVGETIWNVFPLETCAKIETLYRQTLAGETSIVEIFYNNQFYQIRAIPVKNDHGEIFVGMSIWENISKQLEQPLQELPLSQEIGNSMSDEKIGLISKCLEGIEILIVDDDTDSLDFITFVLETEGAIVTQAASALEGLQMLTQLKPKIIVSDIGMPEIDGYMLIERIRNLSEEQGGQVPALALTAYASECDQQQAISAGFQKHISKPIEPEQLVAMVIQLISNR
jgi:CheY-like chemotaxis protein